MIKLKELYNRTPLEFGKVYTDKDLPPFKTPAQIEEEKLNEVKSDIEVKNEKINFTIQNQLTSIIFVPSTSKDMDKLANSGLTQKGIYDVLIDYCEKQTKLKFSRDNRYAGAGYGVKVELESLIDKIK